MKDKRTYTKLKEHGEDMSHENESKTRLAEDRGALDLTYLIEIHKKEIWEFKQKEAEWIKTESLLNGSKKIINELSAKLVDQVRIIAELEQEIKRLVAENKK
jgi:hypothetical protein